MNLRDSRLLQPVVMRLDEGQCLPPVPRLQHRVARLAQDRGRDAADHRLVVDQQERLARVHFLWI